MKEKNIPKAPSSENQQIIDLLNYVLKLEYTIVIHLPRISAAFRDREIRDKVLHLSSASVKHADTVASAIEKLGGKAQWSFEPFPDDGDLVKISVDPTQPTGKVSQGPKGYIHIIGPTGVLKVTSVDINGNIGTCEATP